MHKCLVGSGQSYRFYNDGNLNKAFFCKNSFWISNYINNCTLFVIYICLYCIHVCTYSMYTIYSLYDDITLLMLTTTSISKTKPN